MVGVILGLIGWIEQPYIKEQANWFWIMRPYMLKDVRPYVLTVTAEQALKPGDAFHECAKDCPEMIVVPAGKFLMGSPRPKRTARTMKVRNMTSRSPGLSRSPSSM